MNLSEALHDIKSELKTRDLTDELIMEVAEDHGLNPILLKRKIEENGISAEKVRSYEAQSVSLAEALEQKAGNGASN